jgi:ABC-type phosphate transport system substrate-binding protein
MILASNYVTAQEMVVVINAKNPDKISPEMIKQIYSDKRNFWKSGNKILLFELPVKDKRREIFSKELLNMSAIASQSKWSNRYINNTIKNKVKIKPEKLVAKFVSNYENAIGYISAAEAKKQKNLKIIMTIND